MKDRIKEVKDNQTIDEATIKQSQPQIRSVTMPVYVGTSLMCKGYRQEKNMGKEMMKISKRDIKLYDCDISNAKYNELKYFCKQYQEKKQELNNSYGLGAVLIDGLAKTNHIGKPTEQRAIKNVMLRNDIELIEETAKQADTNIYTWIIKSVSEGMPYEWMDIPLSRTKFYDIRRYFFYLLAQKR